MHVRHPSLRRPLFRQGAVPALFLALAVFLAAGARAEILPPSGHLDFSVIRDGDRIGTHRLTFQEHGDRIEVDVKTRIAVKMAFITVYRFEQDAHEVWENGKLMQMVSHTHDDGTDHTLTVKKDGDRLAVVGDGRQLTVDPDAVPASLWNPGFVHSGELMNSIVGTPLDVKISFVGDEMVEAHGRNVRARHYSMTGEFARELWYDMNWTLVRIELKGKDGSPVKYVLN